MWAIPSSRCMMAVPPQPTSLASSISFSTPCEWHRMSEDCSYQTTVRAAFIYNFESRLSRILMFPTSCSRMVVLRICHSEA
jgi:hypothetical protein